MLNFNLISFVLHSSLKMTSMDKVPKLVVFDLDYTLWPFWVDTHVTPPFRKSNGKVVDARGATIKFYPEVPQILQKLSDMNIAIGVASRTSEIDGAEQLCELFDWNKYFKYKEIYPGCKVAHFNQFKKKTGFEFHDMLFFDDERRNIDDLTKINVTSILVKSGMTLKVLNEDMTLWPIHVDNCQFPFSKDREGNIKDANDFHVQLYPKAFKIIETLHFQKINMAVASRITDIALAYQLLHLFDLRKYFICIEIYPTRKTLHFTQIQKKTGLPFSDMVFYDDDIRNLKSIEKLGVRVFQVVDGINEKLIHYSYGI